MDRRLVVAISVWAPPAEWPKELDGGEIVPSFGLVRFRLSSWFVSCPDWVECTRHSVFWGLWLAVLILRDISDNPVGEVEGSATSPAKCRKLSSMELLKQAARQPSRTSTLPLSWPYIRRGADHWEYEWGGMVPGARDLTFQDAYHFPLVEGPIGECIAVPVAVWDGEPALVWCGAYWDPRARGDALLIPRGAWVRHSEILGMDAPELSARQLVGTDEVGRMAGCSARSIANYLARGLVPAPVVRVGHSPAWTRPQIRRWLEVRPGRPGRPRVLVETGYEARRRK